MDEERSPASVEAVGSETSRSEEETKERRGVTKRGTVRWQSDPGPRRPEVRAPARRVSG